MKRILSLTMVLVVLAVWVFPLPAAQAQGGGGQGAERLPFKAPPRVELARIKALPVSAGPQPAQDRSRQIRSQPRPRTVQAIEAWTAQRPFFCQGQAWWP